MDRKVCVIGAGIAGVSAIKSCLEEGLHPVCFETRSDVGGMWNYNKGERPVGAKVYKSLVTNVSKEAACFSDFPYPKEWRPFITCAQFHEYIKSYITHFGLEQHIHLNTKVLNVTMGGTQGNEQARRWRVTTLDLVTAQEQTQEFDCVMVCSGKNAAPVMPQIKGLGDVTVEVIHSHQYDDPTEFSGKKVLVIGLGNSSADIAPELSREAAKTVLSTRSGAWVIPRVFRGGLPADMTTTTRFNQLISDYLPQVVVNWAARRLFNSGFNHGPLGIQSRYEPMDPNASYLVNDVLPSCILSGRVHIKPDIKEFRGDEVHFCDGTTEKVDVVICGTGYKPSFPFISNSILPGNPAEMKLYEWMVPFNIPDPWSIAVIGIAPPAGGSAISTFECQTRYIAQIMSGHKCLPSVKTMREAYEKDRINYTSHGRPFIFKKKIGFDYKDKLAKMGGFYPHFWTMCVRDPKLAFALYMGPFMAYHYRLVGPHTWDGARERIMNAIENTMYGIKSEKIPDDERTFFCTNRKH